MVEFVRGIRAEICPVVNVFTDASALSAFLVWNGSGGTGDVISGDGFLLRDRFPEMLAIILRPNEVNTVNLIGKIERFLERVQKNYELTVLPWFAIDDTNSSVVQTFFRVLIRLRKFKVTKVYCQSDARLRSEVESLNTRQLPLFDPSDYEELESVGQGGNARVYKMQHKVTGQLIAKKVILERNEAYPNREREISEELSKIRHSERLYVQLACEARRNDVILQEFCAGGDLQQFESNIETGFHLSETQIKRIVYHVAYAVKCLHDTKKAHRDIKLDNIVLTSKDIDRAEIKLLDFGCAKSVNSSENNTQFSSLPPDPFESDIKRIGVLTANLIYGRKALDETEFKSLPNWASLRRDDWEQPSSDAETFVRKLYFEFTGKKMKDVFKERFLSLYQSEVAEQFRRKNRMLAAKLKRNQAYTDRFGSEAKQWLRETVFFASELLESVERYLIYEWQEFRNISSVIKGLKTEAEELILKIEHAVSSIE